MSGLAAGAATERVPHRPWRALRRAVGLVAGTIVAMARVVGTTLATGIALGLVLLVLAALLVSPALAPALYRSREARVRLEPLALRSELLGKDGSRLALLHEEENRAPLAIDDVPDVLVGAVVAVEDEGFFDHRGVDLPAIARAALQNARAGEVVEGGSTITQQLVKTRVVGARRDLGRKVREAVLAARLEEQEDKRQILEEYLNTVYFGEGAYGVAAAAERFFGKPARDLETHEAALLAAVIANPESYNPFRNPEAARRRRAYVLERMADEGHLDSAEAERHNTTPLPTAPHLPSGPEGSEYFVEEVKRRLSADARLGPTPADRRRLLFSGGLRVQTTLDPGLQAAAVAAVRQTVPASPFAAALVAMEPMTGEVRALVGGPSFEQSKFDLATQGVRQPGSSFKTVVLAAALEAGHSPDEVVDGSAPCSFALPGRDEPYVVDNYEGASGGLVPLREATARSLNCAFMRLALSLGPERVVAMAHRLGITRPLQAVPSIALGAEAVSPLDMATVFSTLAADGVRHPPVFVTRVEDALGRVLIEERPAGEAVVDPRVARTVTDVLGGVIRTGTGRAADIGRPAAGKTGTSQEWRDAWFGGYTPQLAAVVWMGSPVGEVPMLDVGGIRVAGGTYPARVWAAFMGPAMANLPPVPFPPPG